MSKISNLLNNERIYWLKENKELFGVDAISKFNTLEEIKEILDKSCEENWNVENPCLFAQKLIDGSLDKDFEQRKENSWRLVFNPLNTCIDVLATYTKNFKRGPVEKELKVASIPSVTENLTWLIGNIEYVPRVTAIKNNRNFVARYYPEKVTGEYWNYDIENDEFNIFKEGETEEDIFNRLTERSKYILGLVEENLTFDNFRDALKKVPIIAPNSVFNYNFARMEYFKDVILNTTSWARPLSGRILGINSLLLSQAKKFTNSSGEYEGSLAASHSLMFSLENFRTAINVFNGTFKPTFAYTDTLGFFDAFKTVTTGQAGRQRLLLDNVVIKSGMLWVVENGIERSMYDYFFKPQAIRLSSMSEAPFCNNDKPKRIMMNAKLSAQSCPLEGELDDITHRIYARVGFADIEGYSFGDSIIISESFAKRLLTWEEDILVIPKEDYERINKEALTLRDLRVLYPKKSKAILMSWDNVRIEREEEIGDYVRILLNWEIPFRLGDKITNLHGAKGTVGLILPDDKMPKLTKKAGKMEKGPLEVIISGFSTMRRGSLGQIFEAWATANEIEVEDNDTFFYKYLQKYEDNMKKFADNSTVKFGKDKIIMPIGLNRIMRVSQHAAIKVSESTRSSDKKLRLGEMEKFNLIANDCENILYELSLRDLQRHIGGLYLLNDLENNEDFPEESHVSLQTATIFKSLGYDIKVDGESIEKSDYSKMNLTLEDIFGQEEVNDEIND